MEPRKLFYPKVCNVTKLQGELIAALTSAKVEGARDANPAGTPGVEVLLYVETTTPADDATVATLVTAHNAAPTTVQAYTNAFLNNKAIILSAYFTFHNGFRNASASPSLAEYRTVLGNTLTVILTLPTAFTDDLSREQAGLQLPGGPTGAWTLAQCQGWHQLLGGWLGRAIGGLAMAVAGSQLDGS